MKDKIPDISPFEKEKVCIVPDAPPRRRTAGKGDPCTTGNGADRVIAESESEQELVGAEEGAAQFGPGGEVVPTCAGL